MLTLIANRIKCGALGSGHWSFTFIRSILVMCKRSIKKLHMSLLKHSEGIYLLLNINKVTRVKFVKSG